MNIVLDSQFSTTGLADTDSSITTTYKPTARTQSAWGSGYSLDIADKVMDNGAYQGQGATIETIMQQADNMNVEAQKDFMLVMSSCVSGEDLQKMQEEGFRPGSTDVETYVSIVDKIKVTLAKAGVEVAGYNDDIDVETVEEITGSRIDANSLVRDLSKMLQESDLPVTNENIAELAKAVLEASGIASLSEDAVKYMVMNQKEPTIENLYKAQFSSAENMKQAQGYFSEGAGNYGRYYAKKADSINWGNLKGQLESVVKQAGLDGSEEAKAAALENAKWLVESGIELNSRNLTLVSDLKNMELPMNQEEILDLCVTAFENGKSPLRALMTGEAPIAERAQEIMETVEGISDEAVHAAAESGVELNIQNLAAAQKKIEQNGIEQSGAETAVSDNSLREIEARRQLEEIRLMMTQEANRHLLKNGISIDTTELSKLVEALKAAEENIRAALFKGESAEENAQMAQLYEETLTKTKQLGQMPAAVVGKMTAGAQGYTLAKLHQEGEELQNQFGEGKQDNSQERRKQAAASYETLMTAPRKDLGDRISKAFRNVDDILEDMDFEASEPNRRAVRILGYNSMEITEENINAVKAADSKVCGVIGRMTPAVTLQMIRERKNPLDMTIDELDEYLNGQNKDLGADAERFSKFLQKLDRSNGISDEEREAYIGIYRMFRQIEKSDGAVIGNIIATGAEMNFKNMLSAIRTRSGKDLDVRIDDGFGGLENLIAKGKAIDGQIMGGYQANGNAADAGSGQEKEQELYYARLSGEINDGLADQTDLEKLKSTNITAETTIEQFADTVKNGQMAESAEQQREQKAESFKEFQRSMQEVEKVDEDIIQTLIDYGQPISADNIEAASLLMMERGSLFKQVFTRKPDNASDEKAEDTKADSAQPSEAIDNESLTEAADKFVECLTDAKNASSAYQELISEANKAVEGIINQKGVSRVDVKAAKALYRGLSLAGNLAREENYEIPIEIKGEITSVNLKIYHNPAKAGKVAITLDSESLGKVAAEFDVTKKRISGMIVYENKQEKETLAQIEQTVKKELSGNADQQVSVSLVHSKTVDLNRFGQDRESGGAKGSDKSAQASTRELYQTAKAFMTAIK